MLEKLKAQASKIGSVIIVAGILYIGMKSFVVQPYSSPKTPVQYSVLGEDGRYLVAILLPDDKAIFWYDDDKKNFMEGNLVRFKGYVGTHYGWRLWNIGDNDNDFGPSIFGLRIYPDGVKPLVLDTEVLSHYIKGSETPVFPNKGDGVKRQIILLSDTAMRFSDMWLKRNNKTPAELNESIQMMMALLIKNSGSNK